MRRFKRPKLLAASFATLLVAGCGPSAPDTPKSAVLQAPPAPPVFEGIIIEGGPNEAKTSGFTVCEANGEAYYGFICKRADSSLLGVKALRSEVYLAYPSELEQEKRLPEKSRYSEVTYDFFAATINYPCDTPGFDPYRCAKDPEASLPRLTKALLSTGWFTQSRGWGDEFFKPGSQFVITIRSRSQKDNITTVAVQHRDAAYVGEEIANIKKDQAERAVVANASTDFVKKMKAD